MSPDDQPEPGFHGAFLRPSSAVAHCLFHQAVIDVDIGSQLNIRPDVYRYHKYVYLPIVTGSRG
jgi:hypothetical protein